MKREVVRDFLSLPGIAGVALMDGRSRPYFCGVDQALNFQQKEALAQGIRQVVETTPEDFEAFEFQFAKHQIYIYKLEQGIILLVLARGDLVQSDYQTSITQLKSGLEADIGKAIITFRLLASGISLPGSPHKEIEDQPRAFALEVLAQESAIPPNSSVHITPTPADLDSPSKFPNGDSPNGEVPSSVVEISKFTRAAIPIAPEVPPETSYLEPDIATTSTSPLVEATEPSVDIKEVLVAMNQLSQFTVQYLGTAVISNYWKSSRPNQDWLNMFQLDRKAQFKLENTSLEGSNFTLNAEQQEWLKEWVSAFVQRCAKVIRDFPLLVEKSLLSDRQKSLLLHLK